MSDTAIRIDRLSKRYRLGEREPYGSLREVMARAVSARVERVTKPAPRVASRSEHIWALDDVSLEIKHGEAVGIIGRNGAGKSTLLRILARITKPTRGRAEIYGRVACLLEVGTGFHPELTGRENVFLNGAILGMKRREIENKFDQIVAFAEIERFLDTPVKRYSSGMYVRLAFAVAAHLEPEILLVDEVLAVGDAAFQKKCLGKMNAVAGQGRAVLFVSHNMAAVTTLCHRLILLTQGTVHYDGETQAGVKLYLSQADEVPSTLREQIDALPPDPAFRLTEVIIAQEGSSGTTFVTTKPVTVSICYEVLQPCHGLRVGFDLKAGASGVTVFRTFHDDRVMDPGQVAAGQYVSTATIPADYLAPLEYRLDLAVGIHRVRWIIYEQAHASLHVVNVDGVNAGYADPRPGVVMPSINWSTTSPHAEVLRASLALK